MPVARAGVLTKMVRMTNVHCVHKNKGFAPQTLEKDENDELAGAMHAKTLFAKNPVAPRQKNLGRSLRDSCFFFVVAFEIAVR